jgi:hypothetical protein
MANERHGLAACVYLGTVPTKLAEASGYSISITGEECEVVRFEDTWKTRLRGVLDATGSLTAYHNQDAKVLADYAQEDGATGTATAVLIYPDCTDVTTYYQMTAWFDFEATGDTGSCQTISAAFRTAAGVAKVGFS